MVIDLSAWSGEIILGCFLIWAAVTVFRVVVSEKRQARANEHMLAKIKELSGE